MDGMMQTGQSLPNLVDLLQARSCIRPDLPVQTFLADGERPERILTCAQLDRRARTIAAALQQAGLAGQTILLLYPPGLDFVEAFFGCLYAGSIAVPAYPPKANRTLGRLQAILRDAHAGAVLSVNALLGEIRQRLEGESAVSVRLWLATDTLADATDTWHRPAIGPDALAFLQYTSGSTGEPKGVMVSHANILHNSEGLRQAFSLHPDSIGLSWLPSFHDMGLLCGVIQPVFTGFANTIMAPAAFLQRPARWLAAISRLRATFSGGPNSAYDLCLRAIPPEQRSGLDLSSWQAAFNGAEPVRAHTLQRFGEMFGPCGFRASAWQPGYGMAEATLMISCGPAGSGLNLLHVRERDLQQHRVVPAAADDPDAAALVACGQVAPDTEVAVVDPASCTRCGPGQIGELWVQGPGVAQGYWNRNDQTQSTFVARLIDTGEGPFLRTGDLGYIHNGQVYVTGRIKDLIIVRGRNFYPQDIEATVERSHLALSAGTAAAFAIEVGQEERLAVVVEVQRTSRRNVNSDNVLSAIRQAVAEEHDLQIHAIVLLQPNSVPKTSSGKIQRQPCRRAFLAGKLEALASWTAPVEDRQQQQLPMGSHGKHKDGAALELWMREQVARRVGLSPEQVNVSQPFAAFGFGSLEAVSFAGELERWLDRPVPATLVYDQPSIAAVVAWLSSQADTTAHLAANTSPSSDEHEPIAIIGLGCRFPGARNPEQFWKVLRDGVDCIRKVPPGRFRPDAVLDDPRLAWGGFIDGVDQFDADFFGLSPREVAHMDPQQRLLLEVTWETLEHAACDPRTLAGTATGVFIGLSGGDYLRLLSSQAKHLDAYVGTGNAASIAANRLSYLLDLRGPSLVIDTACSSSLVAVHMACRSLRSRECCSALAGGVNLILSPEITRIFAQAGMLAADGRCKTFAAGADGYVRGEGCGMVLLKRFSDARADGDRVLAVIRGSAVNQDGRSNGLTAPNGPAQEAVIRAALADARATPADVDYIEAHGTGTELGDPIEVQALAAALCAGSANPRRLRIGSVKTNIGHLEAAAGIAGLIKVVLSLQAGEISAHLHLASRNPLIAWDLLPIDPVTNRVPWTRRTDRMRLAGVSSFGFGGTNAHVIVEEAPTGVAAAADIERPAHLLVLSARDERALAERAAELQGALLSDANLADACFSAAVGRAHFEQRVAIVATDRDVALAGLRVVCEKSAAPNVFAGQASKATPKVAMLFTGQGSQYVGMGRQLFKTQPTFREALLRCDAIFQECSGRRLVDLLYGETADAAELDRTLHAQPALFALEWSLSQLWLSWGVKPNILMGHSLGEYVAACVAGVFSVEDGLRLVAQRARLMDQAPGPGRMIAVFAGIEQVAPLLDTQTLAIAAIQAEREIVVSGGAAAIERLTQQLQVAGISWVPLRVSHAFHSPLMEPILPAYREVAGQLRYNQPTIPVVSNHLGEIVCDERLCGAEYWVRHVREPVLFAAGIRALQDEGITTFLEIGPHPVLVAMAQRAADVPNGLWLGSLRRGREDWQVMLPSLAELYVRGAAVDWRGFDRGYSRHKVSLPTYPFQRQRHWFEPREGQGAAVAEAVLAEDAQNWLYEVRWQPKDRQPGVVSAEFVKNDRVSGDDSDVRAELKRQHVPTDEAQLLADVEDLCVEYITAALTDLGLTLTAGMRIDTAQTAVSCRILPRHRQLFDRLLEILGEAGVLRQAADGWVVVQTPAPARPDERAAELRARYCRDSALLEVVAQCGPHLARVIQGHVDPLGLLFPQAGGASAERLYRDAPSAKVLNALAAERVARAVAQAPAGRVVRILEIGAGTGGTTAAVLPALPADRVSYTFTDVSAFFLSAARKSFAGDARVRYATLDIDRDPAEQGFEPHNYDIVIAANVLHATPDLRRSLMHAAALLAPSGMLVLLEGTAPRRCLDLTFGLLEGWWAFADTDLRPSHALLVPEKWTRLLGQCGFRDTALVPTLAEQTATLAGQRLIVSLAPADRVAKTKTPTAEGTWLICTDAAGFGRCLAERLRWGGATCLEVADRRQLDDALKSASSPAGVVCLWPLDTEPSHGTAETLLQMALGVTQAVVRKAGSAALWFVTRGAQWVAGETGPANPAESGLAGLGQVVGLEHPNSWGGLIDLDPSAGVEQVELLAELLLSRDAETSIALRSGLALVPRLVHLASLAEQRPVPCPDATYLLTGGLGGVGQSVARWLVGQGARHLALLGRKGMPSPESPQARALEELRSLGAEVQVVAADVADRNSLAGALDAIRAQGRPLRGVIHAAGVPGARSLIEISEDEFAAVLRPKLAGGWNLHELTATDPLDLFVCFSSASSILGADGQAHYAAANRCLDALVAWRRSRGLPGLSVNWGRWGTVGMLTTEAHARFAEAGLRPMNPSVATDLLGRLLGSGRGEAMVAAVDWSVLKPLYEARRPRPLLERIEVHEEESGGEAEQGTLLVQLQAAPSHRRGEMLAEMIEREVAGTLGLSPERRLDRAAGFFEMGMDSLMAVSLRGRLQRMLGRGLPKTLAFEHPSVESLAEFLLGECFTEQPSSISKGAAVPASPPTTTAPNEPIAIIGAGCRFPGAASLDAFWRLLENGTDAVGEVPSGRWDADRWYDPDPDAPGRMYTRSGGFLEEVDRFDPQFFGIAPREAAVMDPQHRLLLEVAWEALEHAGCAPGLLKGSRAGIFVGATTSDYTEVLAEHGEPDAYYITGNSLNAAAGRISYLLGLHGPSMVIDAACASSLVAVHLACRSLRTGECGIALAGGVNLILSPRGTVAACRAKMLSPSGRCRTFDAAADGFVRGEGCGVIVLKRLSDARAAGDRILAVLKGSAVGQDGASGGLTVPNASAQQEVIRRALDDAGVVPSQIDYIEAHGTGTSLGDPIEVRALHGVFAGCREPSRPLLLGSVKTNIGHLESASGIAGLIKVALALDSGRIPAHLHLHELNPEIDLAAIPAVVPSSTTVWTRSAGPRCAGVSSFGASGTLAHVVVEEAPESAVQTIPKDRPGNILTLSARSEAALGDLARRLQADLARQEPSALPDVCFSANAGRSHFEHRWAIVCDSMAGLTSKLGALLEGKPCDGTCTGFAERSAAPKVAFSIDADSIDWPAIRELYETSPVVRAALDRCDVVFRQHGLSLLKLRHANDAAVRLALAWCLAELWRSWGVPPAAVWAPPDAANAVDCLAGNVSLEDALQAILTGAGSAAKVQRSSCVEVLTGESLAWPDAELVIPLSAARWAALLNRLGSLYVRGVPIDWIAFDQPYCRRKLALPTYPFQRQRYWADSLCRSQPERAVVETAPLVGRKLSLPLSDSLHYENRIAARQPAYLADHCVRGRVVLPATAYIEMALAAGVEQFGLALALEGVSFQRPLYLPASGACCVHTTLVPQPGGRLAFRIFSRSAEALHEDLWGLHSEGMLHRADPLDSVPTLEAVRRDCSQPLHMEGFYGQLAARGLQFGPAFRGIVALWRGARQALGQVRLSPDLAAGGPHHLHPALLDACSQVVTALAPAMGPQDVYMLVGLDRLVCLEQAGSEVWCHATPSAVHSPDGQRDWADLTIYDVDGHVIATAVGLCYQRITGSGADAALGSNRQVQAAAPASNGGGGRLAARLRETPLAERLVLLESHVREQVARILGLPEQPDPRTGFFDLGMDSLLAGELVAALQHGLGRPVSATVIFEYGTAGALARHLLQEMAPSPVDDGSGDAATGSDALDDLGAEELAALFARTLSEIKGPQS